MECVYCGKHFSYRAKGWKQITENGKRLNGYGICPKCASSPTKLKQQKLTA